MTIKKARLYVAKGWPKPNNVSDVRWVAIIKFFSVHGIRVGMNEE